MGAGHGDQNQHKAELTQVAEQVGVIDAANTMSNVVNNAFGAHVRFFGETNFEGHHLNTMIDMVDSAKPEHLETAGKAMWDARDAISEAAEELNGHIGRVDWTGEAADSFNTWGSKLVTHARQLATFAEAAGTQITAAATGLASVRSSMPPRDTRANPKTVAEIPHVKRVESNHEYAAAVQVEDHRQEAINQMNRLASFYSVSEEALAAQEPPVFETMPDVGVPKPEYRGGRDLPPEGGSHLGSGRTTVGPGHVGTASHTTAVVHHDSTGEAPLPPHQGDSSQVVSPHRGSPTATIPAPGTEIASVGTLPHGSAAQAPSAPAVPSTSGSSALPATPVSGVASPVVGGAFARASGSPGSGSAFPSRGRVPGSGASTTSRAVSDPEGRAGATSRASGSAGRSGATGRASNGPVGRTSATGQAGARGTAGRTGGTPVGKGQVGRGISGGTPRATGTAAKGGPGARGALRGNGVVGGKPKGALSGNTGAKASRGNVVGAEKPAGTRKAPVGIGRRGVVGAQDSAETTRSGQTRRVTSGNPDGVVGTPKGRNQQSAQRNVGGRGAQASKGKQRRLGRKNREDETKRQDVHERDAAKRVNGEHERGPAEA
ncbi:hypothetical protein [Streptomyces sp. NPDC008150]|uniref:hypothetical protein n=1 Tax=Streptomyces sp. NPDC008150 TaxID=3364816 RepID=UPI0036E99F10